MNAHDPIKPATQPINLAHEVLLKADEALCVDEVARAIFCVDKPKKGDLRDAGRMLKELANLGMIEMEPRAGGMPFYRLIAAPVAESSGVVIPPPPEYDPASVAFPSSVVTNNPHTGTPRNLLDIESDPEGLLIVKDGEPLKAFVAGDSEGGETDAPAVDAQREEFTLLGLLADIRAAAGDPDGRLMQDELVQHIAGVVKERDLLKAENLALKTLEGSMPGFGAEFEASRKHREEMSRVIAELQALRTSHTNAINEADRLRAELGAERLARTSLQEQVDNPPAPVAQGYAVKAPKRPLRRFGKEAAAKSAAMAAARLAGRGEVFALVPLGVAVRGAEWKEA